MGMGSRVQMVISRGRHNACGSSAHARGGGERSGGLAFRAPGGGREAGGLGSRVRNNCGKNSTAFRDIASRNDR